MTQRVLSDHERLAWLRLIRSENVGPVTFRRLLSQFGSAEAALDMLPKLAERGGASRKITICAKEDAERELATIETYGARVLALPEPGYPTALAAVEDAPPLITVGRNAHLLTRPCVAIVGARNASLNGRNFAETLARDLAQAGMVVVSGLARGIDTAAHQGALQGGTVAVVAGGIDVIYPPENAALQQEIFASGAIVSEMPFATQPTQRLFPRRNRLISGLSLGIVVVEAALKSGSLITAQQALDQGREIFAVPGSPLDPRVHGTNNLIRNGAHLTESALDILEVLKTYKLSEPSAADFQPSPPLAVSEEAVEKARAAILERLSPSPTAVDELIRDCQFSPQVVSLILLELELAGRLQRQPGNKIILI